MKFLDVKETKFVAAKLQGKSNRVAAISAGYPVPSAKQRGYELMHRPYIQQALGITLEQLGITFEKAVRPIAEALEATKIVTSPTEPDTEVTDHPTRLKAAAMALKLLADEDTTITQKPNVAQYQSPLSDAQAAALQGMDEVELQRLIFRKADEQ